MNAFQILVGYSKSNPKDIMLVGDLHIIGIGLSLNPPQVYSVIDTTTSKLDITEGVTTKLSTDLIGFITLLNNEGELNPVHVLNAIKKMDKSIKHSFDEK